MTGERGGTTRSLEEGTALVEFHKPQLAAKIRDRILRHLRDNPTWHRNDLDLEIPADSKNALGAVVGGLVKAGLIVETGERLPSDDPASHGRKSSVYRLVNPRVSPLSPAEPRPGPVTPGTAGQPSQDAGPAGGEGKTSPVARLFDLDPPGTGGYYEREAAA